MSETKILEEIFQRIQKAAGELSAAQSAIAELMGTTRADHPLEVRKTTKHLSIEQEENIRIIEGVFDGQRMIGPDGKSYSISANYASKSKLVEGDILKLTIHADGSFVYKQIGPIKRVRKVGILMCDEKKREYSVIANGRSYRALNASVSFFKGSSGDEAAILIPSDGESAWAAIDYILKTDNLIPSPKVQTPVSVRASGQFALPLENDSEKTVQEKVLIGSHHSP